MGRQGTNVIRALSRILVATATFISGSSLAITVPAFLCQPTQTAAAPGISSGSPLLFYDEETGLVIRDGDGVLRAIHIGAYRNEQYAYSVSIPTGLYGLSSPPPVPQHGFTINLAAGDEAAWIYVFASYNALFWASLNEAAAADEAFISSQGRDFTALRSSIRMGQLPAIRTVMRYTHPNNGRHLVEERVIAFRKEEADAEIVYEFHLSTEQSRYRQDQAVFQTLLRSWQALPLER